MNEVIIIINGVRCDAVETDWVGCTFCDLKPILAKDKPCHLCKSLGKLNMIFEKSDKKLKYENNKRRPKASKRMASNLQEVWVYLCF